MPSIESEKVSEKTADIDKHPKKSVYDEHELVIQEYIRISLLSSLGLYLRIMKLGFPPFMTEMELEISRQVNWYMAGKFFIGQFPPLMGIICTGIARLVGYYGTEDLVYSGQVFVEFPMVALRRFSALLGALLIPLCYMTLRRMKHTRATATLASALLVFENGIVTQSRFTTPEIYVLFFSAFTLFAWATMQYYLQQSQGKLTAQSGYWQIITGMAMGCALSSKWTGIFTFPIIWTSIAIETWYKLCEKHNDVKTIFKRVFTYILSVGILPLFVYLSIFQFHLSLIPHSGDHDLLVSSRLKYSLQGNQVEPSQPNIAFGSQIVLKHIGTVGGYLHSHEKRFTGGSTQQEVTLYPYIDINNLWTVHKNAMIWNNTHPVEFVRNGDQIRFEHFASNRKLHSHDHRPQLSGKPEHNEVTAYGDRLIMDSHDYWNLQILNEDGTPSDDKTLTWKPLTQQFRLQHIRGCMLISHQAWYIPPLGEGHQEVTCMASAGDHLTSWQVESTFHEKLEGMKMIAYDTISMTEKLIEIHQAMYNYPFVVFNRLQTYSAEDGSASPVMYTEETPKKWFFKKSTFKIWNELAGFSGVLILNPFTQRLIVVSCIVYFLSFGLYAFLRQRQLKLPRWMDPMMNSHYTRSMVTFLSASLIHFQLLPFLPYHMTHMSDILHVMYYGTGLTCVLLESLTSRFPPLLRRACFYGLLFASMTQFSRFSRLAYGGEKWFRSQCEASGLDVDCLRFPPAHHELVEMLENSGRTQNSTLLTIYVELAGSTTQPFRYNQGQEEEADRHIAMLKQNSFLQEAIKVKGTVRYHRAIPTPAMDIEDAIKWAQQVHAEALMRQTQNDQQLQETIQRANLLNLENQQQQQQQQLPFLPNN